MGAAARQRQTVAVWEPQPGPQAALTRCPCFEVFFGGARGGGKTDGMLGEWVFHAQEYGAYAIGLMVRRERIQLLETIERSKALYTPLGAKYHESDKLWRFPDGARLRFAYLERDADAEAYQGHSYTRVYVEEIGNFPDQAPVMKLMATLRSGAGVPSGFRASGNPGGPGHQWVKARHIDPAPKGWERQWSEFQNPWTKKVVRRDRIYIPSRLSDNAYLGADYVANLQMSGSPELVRAWLEGDWTVVTGAFFAEFSLGRHTVRPFVIPADWLRFRSFDWGSAKPFSVGWWVVVGGTFTTPCGHVLPRGAIVCYREWYGASAPNVGLKLTAEQVAEGIVEREKGDKITYGVADPAIYAEDGGPSIGQRMGARKVYWKPADNKRVPGWDQVRGRLLGEDERPMIYWFDTCRDTIRTLPAAQHDAKKAEDIDSDGEDHAIDQVRYAAMSRPWVPVVKQAPTDYGYGRRRRGDAGPDGWKTA